VHNAVIRCGDFSVWLLQLLLICLKDAGLNHIGPRMGVRCVRRAYWPVPPARFDLMLKQSGRDMVSEDG